MQLSSIDVHYLLYACGRREGGAGLSRSHSAVNNRPQVASVTADLISCVLLTMAHPDVAGRITHTDARHLGDAIGKYK